MRRRARLAAAAGLGAPPAFGQAPPRRLGALVLTERAAALLRAHLLPELARRGWREGTTLALDLRIAPARAQADAARDLVSAAPDAIVAVSAPAVQAARAATATIPIVMHGVDFRLLAGTAMARPGGNTTGVAIHSAESEAKRAEMAAELVPGARAVAALFYRGTDGLAERIAAMRKAAGRAGRTLLVFEVEDARDLSPHLAAMRGAGAGALVLGGTPESLRDISLIAPQARAAGLATVCLWRMMVEDGYVLSHGPDFHAMYVRVAHYLSLIFRGVPAGELPIEAPTRIETVIDLRAAAAIGLVVPTPLLARADEVIE
jgi:putative ABC transport system substrate-binding protein